MKLFKDQETSGDVLQALQAASEGCGAGLAVTLAAEKASELSGQARDLAHAGWSRRQRLIGTLEGKQRLPLVLVQRQCYKAPVGWVRESFLICSILQATTKSMARQFCQTVRSAS